MPDEERQTGGPQPGLPPQEQPEYKSAFDEKAAAIPEKQWNLWQLLGGALLGLAGGLCLFHMGGTETFGSVGLVLALLLLLLFPNVLQRNLTRSIQKGRTTSVITFAAVLLLYMLLYKP